MSLESIIAHVLAARAEVAQVHDAVAQMRELLRDVLHAFSQATPDLHEEEAEEPAHTLDGAVDGGPRDTSAPL